MPDREIKDPLPRAVSTSRHRALRTLFLDYEITMISCYLWRNLAPWALEWRTCPDSFLLFPTVGNTRVVLKSGTTVVKPGEFLMLPENTPHALDLPDKFPHLHQFSIHCHIHDRWGRPLLSRFASPFGVLPSQTTWAPMLEELTYLMSADLRTGQERGEGMVRDLLAWQLRNDNLITPHVSASDPRVGIALEIMERDFSSPLLSVEDLARAVKITSVQLRKLFRRETGVSPKSFLQTLRLREATRLLHHTTSSVKEVAAACGFASDHYFHLAFRKSYGSTPSRYREKLISEV
ncbi:MAG: AraC family transcriptional regulator [Chthoniobacterales bacterium]